MQPAILRAWMGFKADPHSPLEIDEQVRAGLSYALVEKIEAYLSLNRQEISDVLIIPQRTLLRRKKAKRFSLDESDRVYRLARVVALADEILGAENAKEWLKTPNLALAHKTPLHLLETDVGTQEVVRLLQRFSHGVFY